MTRLSLEFCRTQHAVGQGGFHSACLRVEDRVRRYVYDCGSLDPTACSRELDQFASRGHNLDFLFISHLHKGHVSGVPGLLAKVEVDTVVMPLLNPMERVYAFAASGSDREEAISGDDFYVDFVINPMTTLRGAAEAGSKSAPRILLVEHKEGGAPWNGGDAPVAETDDGVKLPEGWGFVGQPNIRNVRADDCPGFQGSKVFADTGGLAAHAASGQTSAWILAPYVAARDIAAACRQSFEAEVNKLAGVKYGAPLDRDKLKSLLTTKRSELYEAYRKLVAKSSSKNSGDLNLTSMCLYSGPGAGRGWLGYSAWHRPSRFCGSTIAFSRHPCGDPQTPCAKVGWLGTGDAKLGSRNRGDSVRQHYRKLLDHVSTLVVPHHGAVDDFDEKLLCEIGPQLCIVAAKSGDPKHPGPEVCRAIVESGATGVIVTAEPSTAISEEGLAHVAVHTIPAVAGS